MWYSIAAVWAGLILGFGIGVFIGKNIEREIWREAVGANLKRWRQEQLDAGKVSSWLGGK